MAQSTQSSDPAPARSLDPHDWVPFGAQHPGPWVPSGDPAPDHTPVRRDLCALLDAAGLTGGDAPVLSACQLADAQAAGADLIVNGCDGEFGAGHDAYVLTTHFGQVAAAAAALTSGSVRYAARRGTDLFDALCRKGVGVLEVHDCRTATDAAADSPTQTVALNAESLWRIAQVLDKGPQWFRSVGLPSEPGPRLVTIRDTAAFVGPVGSGLGSAGQLLGGVIETRTGAPFGEVLDAAGASRSRTRAVLVGGLAGGWLSADSAWRAQWSTESLSRYGVSIQSGVVAVLAASLCPVCRIGAMLAHAATEAGECGTCRSGVAALALEWRTLAQGKGSSLGQVEQQVSRLTDDDSCRFCAGLETFTASSLQFFGYDLLTHASTCDAHLGG